MNEIKIYLETTIPNFAVGQGMPEQQKVTDLLIEEIQKGHYEVYISEAVLNEIKATPDSKRRQALEQVLERIDCRLIKITSKIQELAEAYINEEIIPEKVRTDAVHIAAAIFSAVPNLVTWNLKHLANLKTITAVNNYNFINNLPQLRILTPYELVGYLLKEL